VVAPTAENHRIGLAYAAKEMEIPEDTDESKIDILHKLNAHIVKSANIKTARTSA